MLNELWITMTHGISHDRKPREEGVKEVKGVRLYRDSPSTLNLQVRGFTEKQYWYSCARLTKHEAVQLAEKLTNLASEL